MKRTAFHFWVMGARYSSDDFGKGNCPPRLPVAGSALRFAFLSMRASAATGSTALKPFFALLQTEPRVEGFGDSSDLVTVSFLNSLQSVFPRPPAWPSKMSVKCSGFANYSAAFKEPTDARFCRLTPVCSPTIWL